MIMSYWIAFHHKSCLPFITGSQAYGQSYRTSQSDVDMVFLVSKKTFLSLAPYATKPVERTIKSEFYSVEGDKTFRIKTGDFDLIVTDKPAEYRRLLKVTKFLQKESQKKLLTRSDAVATFKKSSREAGTGRYRYG